MEEKITELLDLISENPELSIDLRLFFITGTEFIRIYYGHCSRSVSAEEFRFVRRLTFFKNEDRGEIIEVFSKLEFLVNELIQLKLLGLNAENGRKLDDLLEEVSLDSRVGLLKQWGIINKELRSKIKKVTDVRNDLAHVYDISNVSYSKKVPGKKKSETVSIRQAFDDFKQDFEEVWKGLIEIYKDQQEEFGSVLNVLINQIRESKTYRLRRKQ
jgi:hypothetical protein